MNRYTRWDWGFKKMSRRAILQTPDVKSFSIKGLQYKNMILSTHTNVYIDMYS